MNANAKKIGSVEKYEEIRVEWKIPDFFSVVEDKSLSYKSSTFFFADASWYLLIDFDEDNMSLALHNDETREYAVEMIFGIRKRDNTVEVLGKGIMKGDETCDDDDFEVLELSELHFSKSELVPSDVLTVTCTVKRKTTDSDRPNASDKPSFLKLISE